jgi:hypothetical protein
MSVAVYVYYKVARGDDAAVRALVDAVQTDVRRATGIAGRLLRRRDDPATWMEVYEGVADAEAFEHALDSALARHAFASVLPAGGARHTERFVTF